jgi:hypothetical protein
MGDQSISFFESDDLPGLYRSADRASSYAQRQYFCAIGLYLTLLIIASVVTFGSDNSSRLTLLSVCLFLLPLGIMIWLSIRKPEQIWFNGRAVAESVKTRAWRWMMRAEPYKDCGDEVIAVKKFISDLKQILEQNRSLGDALGIAASDSQPITEKMKQVRELPFEQRLEVYKQKRIDDQETWYSKKTIYNRKRSTQWFWVMVIFHAAAIIMLLYKMKTPTMKLPIQTIALGASSVLSWLQAKRHKELSSSYALAAHEIALIKGEAAIVNSEIELSDFVVNSENAFSREHTQWIARKKE